MRYFTYYASKWSALHKQKFCLSFALSLALLLSSTFLPLLLWEDLPFLREWMWLRTLINKSLIFKRTLLISFDNIFKTMNKLMVLVRFCTIRDKRLNLPTVSIWRSCPPRSIYLVWFRVICILAIRTGWQNLWKKNVQAFLYWMFT